MSSLSLSPHSVVPAIGACNDTKTASTLGSFSSETSTVTSSSSSKAATAASVPLLLAQLESESETVSVAKETNAVKNNSDDDDHDDMARNKENEPEALAVMPSTPVAVPKQTRFNNLLPFLDHSTTSATTTTTAVAASMPVPTLIVQEPNATCATIEPQAQPASPPPKDPPPPASTVTNKLVKLPRVLVLCSHQSAHRGVSAKQQRAFTLLTAHGIAFDALDGADPAHKETRENLFTVSGLRAQYYPQFFLVHDGSELSFWGDWDRLERCNEMGTLAKDLLSGAAQATSECSLQANVHETRKVASSAAQCGFSSKLLLVLCSNQSLTREVAANQRKAYTILDSQGIAYETLDGADASNKTARNKLFGLSGIHAEYPQFFLKDSHGGTVFWGDWQRFETANQAGSLAQELSTGNGTPTKTKGTAGQQGMTTGATGKDRGVAAVDKAATSGAKESAKGSSISEKQRRSIEVKQASRSIETDITVYGATGFVAKHILTYLMQISLHLKQELKITLAGRTPSKIQSIHADFSEKMKNLCIINADATGYCTFDTFAADSADTQALRKMADRTKVVLNCAGPFTKIGSNVVWACATTGADYVDITGEFVWVGEMRAQHSSTAAASGSRIISMCGFDSIPSDLAVHTAVEALRDASKTIPAIIETATTWHNDFGGVNGGTIQTVVDMPMNISHWLFRRPFPFLLADPLILAHPSVRSDPAFEDTRNRLAKAEWWNQLPSFDTIIRMGVSIPFFMAVANAKVVHASAVSLKYGPNFVYHERFLPTGFRMTAQLGTISLVPAFLTLAALGVSFLVLKLPVIGQFLVNRLVPPGSGMPDQMCRAGYAEVYAEVVGPKNPVTGLVDKANCFIAFEGDPGNWVTAQCISESALALVLNREELPPRSEDGFGTPVELLGGVLLKRLKETKVRPIVSQTSVRKQTARHEWRMFP